MRVVIRKRGKPDARGMETGEIWVEAYLPFDPAAFARFEALVAAKSGNIADAVEEDLALADLALTPIDSHKEAMLQYDVTLLAERFLIESRKIDVMHDEKARATVFLAQSFVNTPEIASPAFFPGAWVTKLVIQAGSDEWDKVEKRALDAVSFSAFVTKIEIKAKLITEPS